MIEDCPICGFKLHADLTCLKCGREWTEQIIGGESVVVSKARNVILTGPIRKGALIDEILKPAPRSLQGISYLHYHTAIIKAMKDRMKICPSSKRLYFGKEKPCYNCVAICRLNETEE
jgi:hypothetical protein